MKRYRILIVVIIVLLAVGGFVWFKFRAAAEAFQLDADVIRLRHLKHYGMLIEEYHEKTGVFPYQNTAEVEVYVHVANDRQAAYAKDGPPIPHKMIPFAKFVSELESGLGRPIKERYDPQFAPLHKPNFYIYMVYKDCYFFAVHLHQPFPFAKKVGENYYKAEISNAANERNKASLPQHLFASPEFKKAIEAPVTKAGFFAYRENQYEHFTKQK
ncbi:MAG: hypothetical protein CEE38_03760 [Planctomycetes bacterium B3_Pla]|nr:MAG: hypothetical protein CEE38_03760 [Planctomycetes bacterium B3_Pla]